MRWLLPCAFAVAAVVLGRHAVQALLDAGRHPTGRMELIAGYYLLRTAVVLLFAVFTIGRAEPRRKSREPAAIVACAVAMAAVLAFHPPSSATSSPLVLAGVLVALASCAWLLASVLALGRCFGVLPEARGLVVRGPYRVVRHPIYLGEIGACLGLAVCAPSPLNAAVLAVFCIAQLVRMGFEERALHTAFPEYGAYAATTPRLLPHVLGARPEAQPARLPRLASAGGRRSPSQLRASRRDRTARAS
jgi:protein-S-isoprenylcysteine O-methyltransferase Ste14